MNLDVVIKDPIVRGPLALFPAYSGAPQAPEYLTGPEAEGQGLLSVAERGEGGRVPELTVRNLGTTPVLLIEGESIVGAKQNRTLNVSLLVPGGEELTIPVTCLEQGRWGAARGAARSRRHSPSDLRRHKTMDVVRARRAGGPPVSDQGAIWARIDRYQRDFFAPSPTRAMEDVYDAVDAKLQREIGSIRPLPDQRGVVVAVGDRVQGIDWFDRPSTLASYWSALLAGYAIDALAAQPGRTSIADAEDFVGELQRASQTSVPSVGLGVEHSLTTDAVVGHALEWEGAVVHLAAFSTSAEPRRPRPGTPPIDRHRWFGGS